MANKINFNKQIQSQNDSDLLLRTKEESLRLKKLEFAHAISPIENPISIRILRRDVARLKTELQKRALAQ
jgi:large subunit ribosomal protein L29